MNEVIYTIVSLNISEIKKREHKCHFTGATQFNVTIQFMITKRKQLVVFSPELMILQHDEQLTKLGVFIGKSKESNMSPTRTRFQY